ncbi:retrotransposon protein, putative, ty1-copia subclass [Tanacetum coccineum]
MSTQKHCPFLNGYLSKEVYMEQPEGFFNPKYLNRVCKLKLSIYGLNQASRPWNKRFDDEIKKFGFTQNRDEPCVYLKASGSNVTFLILYVDDILIMRNNIPMLQDVKSYLRRCFAMKDLGEAAYILGIKIYRDRSRRLIGLCQSAYIEKILKRYHMENSKRGSIPDVLSCKEWCSTLAALYGLRNSTSDVYYTENMILHTDLFFSLLFVVAEKRSIRPFLSKWDCRRIKIGFLGLSSRMPRMEMSWDNTVM